MMLSLRHDISWFVSAGSATRWFAPCSLVCRMNSVKWILTFAWGVHQYFLKFKPFICSLYFQTLHMFVIFSSRSWLEWKRSPPSSWPGGTTGSRPTAIGTAFAFSRPSMSRGCPRGRANIVIIRERTTPETVRMRYTQRLNRWVSF